METYSVVGLSFQSSFTDAVLLPDEKCEKIVRRQLATDGMAPSDLEYYVYMLAAKTELPLGLHITRDHPWEKGQKAPSGHHSLNSLMAFKTGIDYVSALADVNKSGQVVGKIRYTTTTVPNVEEKNAVIKRVSVDLVAVFVKVFLSLQSGLHSLAEIRGYVAMT